MGTPTFGIDATSELPPEVERMVAEVAAKALAPFVDEFSKVVTFGLLCVGFLVVGTACAFLLQRGGDYPDLYE